jgi:hypothetical protein
MLSMRICTSCSEEKPDDEFGWRSKPKGVRLTKCKSCQRAYTNKHYAENKPQRRAQLKASNAARRIRVRDFIRAMKEEAGCADCGESDPIVLDFDHLRDKEFNISMAAIGGGISEKRLLDEIAKCEVVCSNCHRRRTHARRLSVNGCKPPL